MDLNGKGQAAIAPANKYPADLTENPKKCLLTLFDFNFRHLFFGFYN